MSIRSEEQSIQWMRDRVYQLEDKLLQLEADNAVMLDIVKSLNSCRSSDIHTFVSQVVSARSKASDYLRNKENKANDSIMG